MTNDNDSVDPEVWLTISTPRGSIEACGGGSAAEFWINAKFEADAAGNDDAALTAWYYVVTTDGSLWCRRDPTAASHWTTHDTAPLTEAQRTDLHRAAHAARAMLAVDDDLRAALVIAVAAAEQAAEQAAWPWQLPYLRRVVADYPEEVQAAADAMEAAWDAVPRSINDPSAPARVRTNEN